MKKVALAVAALFVMSGLTFAQGVAGKWTGETQGRGGTVSVTLDIKADGTGTLMQGQNSSELKEGKVNGSTVTFTTTQQGRGGEIEVHWTGEVKGDELTLTRQAGGGGGGGGGRGPQPITLKRSK